MKTPAFPQQFNGTTEPSLSGMDLRDYFAAKAMQAMMSDPNLDMGCNTVATLSYRMADAMMKARTE